MRNKKLTSLVCTGATSRPYSLTKPTTSRRTSESRCSQTAQSLLVARALDHRWGYVCYPSTVSLPLIAALIATSSTAILITYCRCIYHWRGTTGLRCPAGHENCPGLWAVRCGKYKAHWVTKDSVGSEAGKVPSPLPSHFRHHMHMHPHPHAHAHEHAHAPTHTHNRTLTLTEYTHPSPNHNPDHNPNLNPNPPRASFTLRLLVRCAGTWLSRFCSTSSSTHRRCMQSPARIHATRRRSRSSMPQLKPTKRRCCLYLTRCRWEMTQSLR